MSRKTIATINLDAIHANLGLLKGLAKHSKIIAVVKANAYGNGAVRVAQSLVNKVDIFAVAFLAEALELRDAGITKPILILQGPHSNDELLLPDLHNIIWLLHSEWQLAAFASYQDMTPTVSNIAWLKFDTGMHRLGLPVSQMQALLTKYAHIINHNTVLVSHLANADEPQQSRANAQIDSFLLAASKTKLPVCLANSAASIRFQKAQGDYVRLGIALYGSTPFESQDNPIELAPVMNLEAQIISLRTINKGETVGYGSTWKAAKESVIATVSIGYADGYPRHAPTSTPAWCNGHIIPLVGRVSMDMLTFDVSDLANVAIGDTVQLWGNKLSINQVAEHIGTIGYELMTRVSARVARKYIDTQKPC